MLARQWCRHETYAGQRQRECGWLQLSAPHGCPQDRRSTVRLPRRVRADGKPGTPPQDLLCRFRDLRGQVVESVKERACRRLEQSHRPWHVDSFLCHYATGALGNWWRDSRWYELDYFVSDIAPNQPSSRRWQKMSTVYVPLTDHHGKVVTLQLLGRVRQRVKIEDGSTER